MKTTDLAAYVASRVLHDLSSPLTAVMAGVDTAMDPGADAAVRKMSAELVNEGIEKMSAQLHFLRYAIGSQELNDNQCSHHELRQKADQYAKMRERRMIDWHLETDRISNRQARLLMNMALLAIESVSKDGTLRVGARESGGRLTLECVAPGMTQGWKPELARSIEGATPEEGWGGGRIQPYLCRLIADEIGFRMSTGVSEDGAVLTAEGPAPSF